MTRLGLKDAFARYGATLVNAQWSVSAWAPDGSLVVSLWTHHSRPGPKRTLEFADRLGRWTGPGNTEFRRNVERAYRELTDVRLVMARTDEVRHVEDGQDASKVKKDFVVRDDLVGKVVAFDGESYVFRFEKG